MSAMIMGVALMTAAAAGPPQPEMLHAARCIDSAAGHGRRAALRAAHLAYLDSIRDRIAVAGAIVASPGAGASGSLLIYHAADLDAAKALLAGDPLSRGGVYAVCEWTSFRPVVGTFVGGWRIDPGVAGTKR